MNHHIARRLAQPIARTFSQAPSPVVAYATPWVTVALASMVPNWPMIAAAPVVPPLGYMALLAWRQLRPGLLPVWAGIPLGFVDDLFSGQPFGCALLLWSLTMLALDIVEARFPWRNFVVDWMVGSALIVTYVLACLVIANHAGGATPVLILVPQMLFAMALYPIVGRTVGRLDRWRLVRYRVIG